MTRKNAILIFITVLLVAIGLVLYLTFFDTKEDTTVVDITQDNEVINTFFPTSNNTNEDDSENEQQNDYQVSIPKLRQLSNVPVSGFVSFEREVSSSQIIIDEETGVEENIDSTETETVFRYVERSTGNVYETTARDTSLKRITNTTIPKVYEAIFTDDGEGVVLRYLDAGGSIETFVANIKLSEPDEEESEQEKEEQEENIEQDDEIRELVGVFLPKNISSITKSPTTNDFFYIVEKDGRSLGYTFNFNSPESGNLIFQSDILQWVADWYSDTNINVYTKPTYSLEGFSFVLNAETERLTKILDNQNGLTTKLSPDGTKTIFSSSSSQGIQIGIYDLTTNNESILSFDTLSNKCVWGDDESLYCATPKSINGSGLPDLWYQGVKLFDDTLIYVNLKDSIMENIDGLGENNFDIINSQLSTDRDYYIFMNKKDLTLWSLDLRT